MAERRKRIKSLFREEWHEDPFGVCIIAITVSLMIAAVVAAAMGNDQSVLRFEIQVHATTNGAGK